MRFMQRSLMGLFLLAVTLGLLALAASSVRSTMEARLAKQSRQRPAQERVFTVNVLTAERVAANPVINVFGEIRSRRTLDLRAPASGQLVFVSDNFVEGGHVAKGELLLRLDQANAKAAVEVAETDLAEAGAEKSEAAAAVVLAQDELDAAHAQSDLRRAARERQDNLLERGVGSHSAVETAALAESAATQAVLGKRQAMAVAEARVHRADTSFARAEIRLEDAKRRLEETEIYAGFDGVLSSVTVVEGGIVGTNERIGRLIDPDHLEVAFRVSNAQYARLVEANAGAIKGSVLVRLDMLGAEVIAEGTIERVSAEVGEGQTGRQVYAHLPTESASSFRPGDFVSVEVAEPQLDNVVILPAQAVSSSGVVLVVGENNRLEELSVNVLRKQGDTVIVRARQLVGREVVEARSPFLGAGIRVKPVRKDAAPPPEPEMVKLDPERRAKLVAFVEGNTFIPDDAKQRILNRLKQDLVPSQMIERLESRMGG